MHVFNYKNGSKNSKTASHHQNMQETYRLTIRKASLTKSSSGVYNQLMMMKLDPFLVISNYVIGANRLIEQITAL